METLSNNRHELMAIGLAAGKTQRQAYLDAGYHTRRGASQTSGGVDVKASLLAARPDIKARVAEIQEASTALAIKEIASITTASERRQILSDIERGKLADHVDLEALGITNGDTAALSEVTVTDYPGRGEDNIGAKKVTKIKMHNPITATSEHNKMDHVYEERDQGPGQVFQTFVFILPDGTKVRPGELIEHDNRGRDTATQGNTPIARTGESPN